MSEMSDAIAALAESQMLVIDVLRQNQATAEHLAKTVEHLARTTDEMAKNTTVTVQHLGLICDQNAEILVQMERDRKQVTDSVRELRVVRSEMEDVKKRLAPIEAAYKAAQQTRPSSGPSAVR